MHSNDALSLCQTYLAQKNHLHVRVGGVHFYRVPEQLSVNVESFAHVLQRPIADVAF